MLKSQNWVDSSSEKLEPMGIERKPAFNCDDSKPDEPLKRTHRAMRRVYGCQRKRLSKDVRL